MEMKAQEIFSELVAITKPAHRGKVWNFRVGEHKSRRIGSGYDIHNIREWQQGDPLIHIDLESSLPTWPKKIYILETIEPKYAPVILVADISPSIFVQVDELKGKFKLMLQCLGAIGLGANRLCDPVGILGFSDQIKFYLSPKFGSGWLHYAYQLLFVEAEKFEKSKWQRKIVPTMTGLNTAIQFLVGRLRRKQCSIVLFSDFADIICGRTELEPKTLKILSALHNWNVIAVMLDDPLEFAWEQKAGVVTVQDAETGKVEEVRASAAGQIRQEFIERRETLRQQLEKVGVDSVVLSYGDHFQKLAQFLSERREV